jgi:hypothetical protein
MNRAIAERWVAALRSGDYQQGFCRLRSLDNRFCCLGVLCNLHAIDHPEIAAAQSLPRPEQVSYHYMGGGEVLPNEVRDWAGMRSCGGRMSSVSKSLCAMNDARESFDYIARKIELYWKEL